MAAPRARTGRPALVGHFPRCPSIATGLCTVHLDAVHEHLAQDTTRDTCMIRTPSFCHNLIFQLHREIRFPHTGRPPRIRRNVHIHRGRPTGFLATIPRITAQATLLSHVPAVFASNEQVLGRALWRLRRYCACPRHRAFPGDANACWLCA